MFSMLLMLGLGYYLGYQHLIAQTQTERSSAQTSITEHSLETLSSHPQCNCNSASQFDSAEQASSTGTGYLFIELLKNQRYSEAMELYLAVRNISEQEYKQLRQAFIQHIIQIESIKPVNFSRIHDAIDHYISEIYDDTGVLLLQAQIYVSQGQFYEALNITQQAFSYAYSETEKKRVLAELNLQIQNIDNTLSQNEDWRQLINILYHVQDIGFLEPQVTLRLIELHLHQEEFDTAKLLAEQLANQEEWQQTVEQLLEKYDLLEEENDTPQLASTIKLKKISNQFILPVQFANTPVQLLIDTGASITTISQSFYEQIKTSTPLSFKGTQSFLTANGKVDGAIYQLNSLTIGDYSISNVDVAVLDFPTTSHSSGLLGMNILEQFSFQIDQQAGLLKLEPNR